MCKNSSKLVRAQFSHMLGKGFRRAKFWAKLAFWRGGGGSGRSFSRRFARSFFFRKVFGLVLLGHSEQKELQQKLQPKSPTPLRSKTCEN